MGVEDLEFPRSLDHWSCPKAPESLSEVSPGPSGSYFSSVKPLMDPAFFQRNLLSPDVGRRNHFFSPMLNLLPLVKQRSWNGKPSRNPKKHAPKISGRTIRGWAVRNVRGGGET